MPWADASPARTASNRWMRAKGKQPRAKPSKPKRVRAVDWKLSNGTLKPEDVKQGGLPVCPVAAILAALAHTAVGQKYLDGLVTEYDGVNIKTVLSGKVMDDLAASTSDDPDYKAQDKEILSKRYFTVKFWKGEIPDTLYVEYTDGSELNPVFMTSPNQVLWPAVIEKACAFHWGSYKDMGNYKKLSVNDHWELIFGKKPRGGFLITDSTNTEKIRTAAENAGKIPTIAASREHATKVTPWHGFTVFGMAGAEIQLYDPHARLLKMSLEDFRDNFQAIYFDSP
jgi:hypothetical protein